MFKHKNTIIIGLLIISGILNSYFIKNLYFAEHEDSINNTKIKQSVEIKSSVQVTKIETDKPQVKIENKNLEETKDIIIKNVKEEKAKEIIKDLELMAVDQKILERLENTVPILNLEDIRVTQTEDEKWLMPEKVKGELSLDYLKYNIEVSLNTTWKYNKLPNDLFSVGYFFYYQDEKIYNTASLLFKAKLPFINFKFVLGLGLDAFSLGSGVELTKNSFLQGGMLYTYKNRFAPYVGISFNF